MGDDIQEKKESSASNPWLTGGLIGSRSCVLQFRCSALSKAPINSPGDILHMTYKTFQAETKLLAAILNAHGLREAWKAPTKIKTRGRWVFYIPTPQDDT